MKKIFSFMLCVFVIFTFSVSAFSMSQSEIINHFTEVINQRETEFNDTSEFPWAVEPIKELAKRGIVNGTGNGNFSPKNTVSRYEFLKMITGVCGIVNPNAQLPYSDVPADHWAYVYVASAYEAGLLDIYSKVIFNGAAPITREEIAYISIEAMIAGSSLENLFSSEPSFTDAEQISDYAKFHITTLNAMGVVGGRDDGRFSPKDYATRAESAKIIYNILCITEINFN